MLRLSSAGISDDAQVDHGPMKDALVAQLDRALDYESRGREFESSRARHFPSFKVRGPWLK